MIDLKKQNWCDCCGRSDDAESYKVTFDYSKKVLRLCKACLEELERATTKILKEENECEST